MNRIAVIVIGSNSTRSLRQPYPTRCAGALKRACFCI